MDAIELAGRARQLRRAGLDNRPKEKMACLDARVAVGERHSRGRRDEGLVHPHLAAGVRARAPELVAETHSPDGESVAVGTKDNRSTLAHARHAQAI